MLIKQIVCAVFVLCVFAACTNHFKEADNASLRGDWDGAVAHYEIALADSSDAQEISRIKEKLDAAKKQASQSNVNTAKQFLAINDIESAYRHAEKAFRYSPTVEIQNLLKQLRLQESDRLFVEGKQALQKGHLAKAVTYLEKSKTLAPTEINAQLLNAAKRELIEYNKQQFSLHEGKAIRHLEKRNWAVAKTAFASAHKYGSTPLSVKHGEFVTFMLEGEQAVSTFETSNNRYHARIATSQFENALRYQIDSDYVQARLKYIKPADYVLTIHSAVVLPFKPVSRKAWDGLGQLIEHTDKILDGLSYFLTPQGVAFAKLSTGIAQITQGGTAAPDCYIQVVIGNQVFGGRHYRQQDDHVPVWNLRIKLSQFTKSANQIVNIIVRDADLKDDDNVGSYQLRLGDLLGREGVHEIPLFSSRKLHADGLLALKVSVERQ